MITKQNRKYIESEIVNYKKTKLEYQRLENEILYGQNNIDENIGGGKSNIPISTVENRVIKRIESKQLQRLESVINAIEGVYMSLDSEKQEFLRLCFWERRFSMNGLANKLCISRATAFRWKYEIIDSIAVELGF